MWRSVSANGVIANSKTGPGDAWNGPFTFAERLERCMSEPRNLPSDQLLRTTLDRVTPNCIGACLTDADCRNVPTRVIACMRRSLLPSRPVRHFFHEPYRTHPLQEVFASLVL
jgi:hypothetical protein